MAKNHFSGPTRCFHDISLPETGIPAGYGALIDYFGLSVPMPRVLFAIGERHKTFQESGCHFLTPRHAPSPTVAGHLKFALKYEGLDLAVIKRLFLTTGPHLIEGMVRAEPSGAYARRLWFLYEWLIDAKLTLPSAESGRYVPVVDPEKQWTVDGEVSSRHRVYNNLPGVPALCPLVFRTETLNKYVSMDLRKRALDVLDDVPRDLLARCAAFLMLKDSKSSYAIEGDSKPQDRIQRWARAIGEAGSRPLDEGKLLRLQEIIIGDSRFVSLGLRDQGGFVGEHDRADGMPIPVHISARPEDLPHLVGGLLAFERGAAQRIDPVVAASVLAFAFVYIHPFEDGNGRIHRYLIHHILARRGFNPPGIVFPVSATILDLINEYRQVLEGYSERILPLIKWESTPEGNIRVQNDTGDFYRYFDATPHAEFLYRCVHRTIEKDLPEETQFLRNYDEFCTRVESVVDMPEKTINLLFRFLEQNGGRLSNRARSREFSALTDKETGEIEEAFAKLFGKQ